MGPHQERHLLGKPKSLREATLQLHAPFFPYFQPLLWGPDLALSCGLASP